jgi:hypothetical protein
MDDMDDMIGLVKVDRQGLGNKLRDEGAQAAKRLLEQAKQDGGVKHRDGTPADVKLVDGRFSVGVEELGKLLGSGLNQGFDIGFGMALKVVESIMDGPPKDDEKKHDEAKSPLGFEVPGSKAVH